MKRTRTLEASFKTVSIHAEVASIGIKIQRENLTITDADEFLTNAQLETRLTIHLGGKHAKGQPELIKNSADLTLDAVVTVKGFSARKNGFSATLSMPVDDTDCALLARFANRSGSVKLQRKGDAPDVRRGRPAASDESE